MDAKPLKEVASGGEISRIMLSLKELISEKDIIDTMVFDEIDTGISGRIAQMVGRVMQKISLSKQIIAITHLPQIASYGDKIFNVEKKELTDTNMTIIKELSLNEKVIEIAKMIGGEIISDSALKSATELINQSKQ
jgi:DNA repair protein RecN (Recombination protein N)